MTNAFWVQTSSSWGPSPLVSDALATKLASHKITDVWVTIGTFNGTSSLNFWTGGFQACVNNIHAHGMKAWAAEINSFPQSPINVSDYALANACALTAKNFVKQYGFDGWIGGDENYTGNASTLAKDYCHFQQMIADAMHGIVQKHMWTPQCWPGMSQARFDIYTIDTHTDAISPMVYDRVDPWIYQPALHKVLQTSVSPILVGFAFRSTQTPPTTHTLADELEMLDSELTSYPSELSKYVGTHLWFIGNPDNITAAEWGYWDAWPRKDSGLLDSVLLQSSPQPVTFMVNGVSYPSGSTLQIPRGSILNISVPQEVEA